MPHEKVILGLSDYEIKEIEGHGEVIVKARYTGPSRCPHCQSEVLRTKDVAQCANGYGGRCGTWRPGSRRSAQSDYGL